MHVLEGPKKMRASFLESMLEETNQIQINRLYMRLMIEYDAALMVKAEKER